MIVHRLRRVRSPRSGRGSSRRALFGGALVVFLGVFVTIRLFVPDSAAEPHEPAPGAGERWVVTWRTPDGQVRVDVHPSEALGAEGQGLVLAAGAELIGIERDAPVELFDDFQRTLQWHLDAVPFESVHDQHDGSGVVVAVIDTAIALEHEDLGTLVAGFDAINDEPMEPADWATADADHGSHVAGVINAQPDNGVGGHGAAPGAAVMPVRVLTAQGGFVSDVAQGVLWAIENGADVLNLSLGSSSTSVALETALAEAERRGVVVVAAIGNHGLAGSPVRYPAAIDTVISVGGVTEDLEHWLPSSSAAYLDVVAPAEDILSLGGSSRREYRFMSGTSMATPQVSALVALLLEADPDLTPEAIRTLLRATAIDLADDGHDTATGYGLVSPGAALAEIDAEVEPAPVPPPPPPPPPAPTAPVDLTADFVNGEVVVSWELPDGVPDGGVVVVERDGIELDEFDAETRSWVDRDPRRGGLHVYTVTARSEGGEAWTSVSLQVPEVQLRHWIVTDRGRVIPLGDAPTFSPAGDHTPAAGSVIGGTPTHTGGGYWLAYDDGRVEAFGDAAHHGDMSGVALAAPVVGMTVAPTGGGYWLVARDGGVFAFGDAQFHGSTGAIALNQPVVDMAVTASGNGYFLVAQDGGIFAFGDAVFRGSTGDIDLNEPVVSMTASGDGYWLVARDGGVFTFGVPFLGSVPGLSLDATIEGRRIRAVDEGAGYLVLLADGALYGFGSAGVLASEVVSLEIGEQAVDLLVIQI